MPAEALLRKAALERMASPEQLDMAMRVTSPLSWLALAVVGALIVTAVVLSIVFQLQVPVDASGLIMQGEIIRSVEISESGTLVEVGVGVGDLVEKGQIVAKLDPAELDTQIRTSRDRIEDLASQETARSKSVVDLKRSYQVQIGQLQERRANIEELVRRQIKTKNDLAAIDAQIAQIRSQIFNVDLGEAGRENQLKEERRKLQQLEASREGGSTVRSAHSGRVAAVLAEPGTEVAKGQRLLNLEDPDAPVRVLLFVPFAEGKKVLKGMPVRILPTTVKREEDGEMVGTIESVSSQPVTPEEVQSALNNDQLAQRFAKDTPFRVVAVPEVDESTPSGFKWTSAVGPDTAVAAGTPCTARVIVDHRRPISYVIPMVKRMTGISS
jgi:HlyD family secretion protein